MTWVALADQGAELHFPGKGALLLRGTIVTEVELGTAKKGQGILEMPWGAQTLNISFDGASKISARIGTREGSLSLDGPICVEIARLSLSWDVARGWAELAIDQPESSSFKTAKVPVPEALPLTTRVLRRARMNTGFFAVADSVMPLGPLPALASDTPIRTESAFTRVKDLRRGQRVLTGRGTFEPVLHLVKCQVPARGRHAPIRLRAPYLELRRDIVVGADQRIELRGTDVEYSFGKEAVYVAARALANGHAAHPEPSPPFVTYHHVVLPSHDSVLVAGASLESLYIGRIRRHPGQLSRTMFRNLDKAHLPEHGGIKHPALRPFDASVLLDQRAA